MYVKIAFPIPHINYFTYKAPDDLSALIKPGMLCIAPFGNQSAVGVILESVEGSGLPEKDIRNITGLGDQNLSLSPEILKLITVTANRYGTTPGMVFKTALPPGSLQRKKVYFYPGPVSNASSVSKEAVEFVSQVHESPGRFSFADLKKFGNLSRAAADDLILKGVISLSPFKSSRKITEKGFERWVKPSPKGLFESSKLGEKSRLLMEFLIKHKEGTRYSDLKKLGYSASSASTLHKMGLIEYENREKKLPAPGGLKSLGQENIVELTLWQRSAMEQIETAMKSGDYRGFLLYGVTSSGKTQVYMEAAKIALRKGKSVLVLVPEISLTPQIVERFERFLDIKPLVWHSNLNPTEKYLIYKSARSGKGHLLIGARSAIFSPLEDLGLIIIDEEQDGSYKQDDPAPRYNARDLAIERGKITGATVILGSATPSCESYHAAQSGRLELLSLPQRVTGGPGPEIKIISTLRDPEKDVNKPPIFPNGFWPISISLYEELSIRLKNKEQIIILLNRRGYSSSLICFECGWLGKCPDCEIGWTYHKTGHKLVCHYCGKEKRGLSICPNCNSTKLSFRGAGTQRLEESLQSLFPDAKIERLDSDIASKKLESKKVLDSFGRGEFQILLGTQMVAKGHHFPKVGFVAVIGADIGISLPDFRASEKVLQLLTQAAGRAGRSAKKKSKGMMMAQTYSPDDSVFNYLRNNDYTGFLDREMKFRQELNYPPFCKIIFIVISSIDKTKAKTEAENLKSRIDRIAAENNISALGPAQAPIFRRGKLYRYQLLLKVGIGSEPAQLFDSINKFSRGLKGVSIKLDVDPWSFM